MTEEDYSAALRTVSDALSPVARSVRIVGEGCGRFLAADSGNYSIEFYASADGFIIDPAIQEELQGERTFTTIGEALSYAADWLRSKR
jgi:hypothetical protein